MANLNVIAEECERCSRCGLGRRVYHGKCSNAPLDGTRGAIYMMVGASPSIEELDTGIFKSSVFKEYENLFYERTGLAREYFYATNICKCSNYSDKGKGPSESEIKKCLPYLEAEIECIKPKMVITFGKIPFKVFTGLNNFEKAHGELQFSGRFRTSVFPMIAPTKARFESETAKAELIRDIDALAALLKK